MGFKPEEIEIVNIDNITLNKRTSDGTWVKVGEITDCATTTTKNDEVEELKKQIENLKKENEHLKIVNKVLDAALRQEVDVINIPITETSKDVFKIIAKRLNDIKA